MRRLTLRADIFSPYGTYLTPYIDAKRPFGNSYVLGDIAEECGFETDAETGEYSADDAQKAAVIMAELPIAIKLALTEQKPLAPGLYALDCDGDLSCEIFNYRMTYGYAMQYKALKEAQEKGIIPAIRENDSVYLLAYNNVGNSDPFEGIIRELKHARISLRPRFAMVDRVDELLKIYEKYHEEYLHSVYCPDNAITSFTDVGGENFFLSNFYNTPIEVDGITYKNVEAAFQAQKTMDVENRKTFSELSAKEAKSAGRRVKLRQDWEKVKDTVMLDILRRKFGCDEKLKQRLLDTGDKLLVEGNFWHDNYWGNCTCEKCRSAIGENKLGNMLMYVREELRTKESNKDVMTFDAARYDKKKQSPTAWYCVEDLLPENCDECVFTESDSIKITSVLVADETGKMDILNRLHIKSTGVPYIDNAVPPEERDRWIWSKSLRMIGKPYMWMPIPKIQ